MKKNRNLIKKILLIGNCSLIISFLFSGCENFRDPLNYPGRQGNMQYATAPGIHNLFVSSVSSTTASIKWVTDKPGNTQVSYHSGANPDTNLSDAKIVVNHSITLTGLSIGTRYFYTVRSKDPLGNAAVSAQMQFVTAGGAVSKPDSQSSVVVNYTLSGFTSPLPQEAVWIEDSQGKFIKTLYVSPFGADLPTWSSKSGGNDNGTTGATKIAGPVSWNCTDTNAAPVPAGTYQYFIEVNQRNNPSALLTRSGSLVLGNSSGNSIGGTGGFITALSGNYTP